MRLHVRWWEERWSDASGELYLGLIGFSQTTGLELRIDGTWVLLAGLELWKYFAFYGGGKIRSPDGYWTSIHRHVVNSRQDVVVFVGIAAEFARH